MHTSVRRSAFEEIDRFISDMDRAVDLDQILAILKHQVHRLGFENFTYWLIWPSEGARKPLYLSSYPAEWTDYYVKSDFKSHDIIANRSATSFRPFLWSDLRREKLTKLQRPVFDDAIAFGLRAGGNIPIHGPGNAKATFTVSNDCSDLQFEILFTAKRHELQLIATYTHEKIMLLGLDRTPPTNCRLTPREIEVLTWSAKGKTQWEIGEILHISEETVRKHVSAICQRLGATNKTQATVVAVMHGLIIP